MSYPDKKKLDSIQAFAEANQNAFSSILIVNNDNVVQGMLKGGEPVYVNADTSMDTVILEGQNGISIIPYSTENKIVISVSQDPLHRFVTDDQILTWNATLGELTWEGIANKPTTIDGYGITDATKVEASEANGNIIINNEEVVVYVPQTYYHVEMVPSDTWVIVHNLNRRPSVTIVDSSGEVVYGDISYQSDSQLTVKFSAGFSGKAYLN